MLPSLLVLLSGSGFSRSAGSSQPLFRAYPSGTGQRQRRKGCDPGTAYGVPPLDVLSPPHNTYPHSFISSVLQRVFPSSSSAISWSLLPSTSISSLAQARSCFPHSKNLLAMASEPFPSEFGSDSNRRDEERFPEVFRQGPMADRHKATRVVPMRVLVFGLPRTGTSCRSRALITLIYSNMVNSNQSCPVPYGFQQYIPFS